MAFVARWSNSPRPRSSNARRVIAETPPNSPMQVDDGCMSMAPWPSRDASTFTKLNPHPSAKLIRTPAAYTATHDTMPAAQQVLTMEPTHQVLRLSYQGVDHKMTGKRDSQSAQGATSASPRPPKTPRHV